jgi:hypothetical protein
MKEGVEGHATKKEAQIASQISKMKSIQDTLSINTTEAPYDMLNIT